MKLSNKAYNAFSKLTSRLGLDDSFDIYDNDTEDCGFDFDNDTLVPLETVLTWIREAIAYSAIHDDFTKSEAVAIADTFKEFHLVTDEWVTWWLKGCED